jgi:hypothetical protein
MHACRVTQGSLLAAAPAAMRPAGSRYSSGSGEPETDEQRTTEVLLLFVSLSASISEFGRRTISTTHGLISLARWHDLQFRLLINDHQLI